jgi:hypothetical protein
MILPMQQNDLFLIKQEIFFSLQKKSIQHFKKLILRSNLIHNIFARECI